MRGHIVPFFVARFLAGNFALQGCSEPPCRAPCPCAPRAISVRSTGTTCTKRLPRIRFEIPPTQLFWLLHLHYTASMNPSTTVPGIALTNGQIPASVDSENRPCGCGGGGGVGCVKPNVPWVNGEVVHGQACERSVDPDYSEVGRYVPIKPLLLSARGEADYNRLGAIVCNHCIY